MQQGSDAAAAAAAHQQHRRQFMGLTAYDRHKRLIAEYVNFYGGKMPAPAEQPTLKTDYDVLREQYRFIRSEEEDAAAEDRWALRLAKRYYSKLYREYAIVDLSRYQEDKVGMRWRSEKEVIAGKGQFSCGARGCPETRGLATFEVPFGYQEAGEKKQALVKVRVCPEHAQQLNFRKNQEALRVQMRAAKKQKQRRGSNAEGNSRSAEEPEEAMPAEAISDRKRRRHGDVEPESAGEVKDKETQGGEDAVEQQGEKRGTAVESGGDAVNVWKRKQPQLEASKDEEFDEYFSGMFL